MSAFNDFIKSKKELRPGRMVDILLDKWNILGEVTIIRRVRSKACAGQASNKVKIRLGQATEGNSANPVDFDVL